MTMNKSIKNILASMLIIPVLALGVTTFTPATASAKIGTTISEGINAAKSDEQPDSLFDDGGVFSVITSTALYLIGALSVIMLIYGGIRYTLSAGDAKQVEAAKNTIMYAVIGIIVALLAFAIINFVLSSLSAA